MVTSRSRLGNCAGPLLVVALFGAIAVCYLKIGYKQRDEDVRLDSRGATTVGVVRSVGSLDRKRLTREVRYSYEADGVRHSGSNEIAHGDAENLSSGLNVNVVYDAGDPSIAKLTGVRVDQYYDAWIFIGWGFVGACALVLSVAAAFPQLTR